MSSYGEQLRLTIFGASHAPEIGMILEGMPAGEHFDLELLQRFLDRRAPGRNPWSTTRREADRPVFLSGLRENCSTGEALKAVIPNRDTRSRDYAAIADIPRPGHADYPARVRYGEAWDGAGGGPFSGRMTAPLCIAGGLCLQALAREGIQVISRVAEIGGIQDVGELTESTAEKDFPVVDDSRGKAMIDTIMEAREDGDSLGGVVECKVLGLPVGLGGPLFEGLESRISALVFAIPAVKGLEFGAGFAAARLRGSENNDPFVWRDGRVLTVGNHAGGILGGMSNGMPLCFRVGIKPTPSIARPQQSVNLATGETAELRLSGRHDPCVVPRAVPAVEAAAAVAIYDALLSLRKELESMELPDYRNELDALDTELVRLFRRRMEISREIGIYKAEHELPVFDGDREREKLDAVAAQGEPFVKETRALFTRILELSRACQEQLPDRKRCGLLGEKLGHSYSPQIHALLADYAYELYEKAPEDVEPFLRGGTWDGLNVTIPYKKTVLPFCDELSETARAIGSVNTLVRRPDGTIFGENTDAYGFRLLLQRKGFDPRGKKALVLGSGGASAMVCAVLKEMGAAQTVVISRRGTDHYNNLGRHADARLIVNATPVGMYPRNGEAPVDLRGFPACEAVVDLIYNPARTALLLQAERLGIPCANGLCMLVAQAKRSSEIFTDNEISDSEIERITALLSRRMQNIVLIGMPGSGKSKLAEILGKALNRPVLEADAEVEKASGKRIPQIFAEEGEEGFRRRETAVLRELGKCSGAVIATGGGCVTREENFDLLHQNGILVWRKRDISKLAREGRPISLTRDPGELYAEREPLYRRFADHVIEETDSLEEAAERILETLT